MSASPWRGSGVTQGSKRSGVFGDAAEAARILDALESHTLNLFDPKMQGFVSLGRALQQRENSDTFFNAVDEAWCTVGEWRVLEGLLKSLAKMCGEATQKQRLLGKCFARGPRHARRLLHTFRGTLVDWRWKV